jgi:hypothetical protein
MYCILLQYQVINFSIVTLAFPACAWPAAVACAAAAQLLYITVTVNTFQVAPLLLKSGMPSPVRAGHPAPGGRGARSRRRRDRRAATAAARGPRAGMLLTTHNPNSSTKVTRQVGPWFAGSQRRRLRAWFGTGGLVDLENSRGALHSVLRVALGVCDVLLLLRVPFGLQPWEYAKKIESNVSHPKNNIHVSSCLINARKNR